MKVPPPPPHYLCHAPLIFKVMCWSQLHSLTILYKHIYIVYLVTTKCSFSIELHYSHDFSNASCIRTCSSPGTGIYNPCTSMTRCPVHPPPPSPPYIHLSMTLKYAWAFISIIIYDQACIICICNNISSTSNIANTTQCQQSKYSFLPTCN